jgi:hypothetical protein
MSDDDLKALYTNTQAIHNNESNGAPDSSTIVNPASGAEGSMQVMPATQKDPGFGVRPSDGTPEDTARAGRDYYAAMSLKYKDPFTAAVAYNWGPGKADKWIANGAKLEDLPEETLKYAYKMHQQQGGNPDARTETPAAPKGTAKNPAAPKDSPKEDGGFLKTADDFVRGVADTATFGLADKFAAKMDELTGRTHGTSYEQNLAAERQKDKDGGVANTAGQVAGALVPGLGVLKAAQAPATASRVVRGLYGAGTGAVEGAAAGLGHNDSDDLGDKLKDAGSGAAVGAALGGPLAAILPASTKQKVTSYIAKQGGEEQARRAAEATGALKKLSERETQNGVPLGARDANAVGNRYVQEAMDATTDPKLRQALQRGRALTDEDLSKLPPEIAEQIRMSQTVSALTAAKPASNNIVARGGRMVADNLIPIKPVRDFVVNHVLGGRATREQTIQDLLKQSNTAQAALEKLGPSKASQGLSALKQQAADAAAAKAATVGQNATDGAARAAQRAADKEAQDIAKGVLKGGFDRAATQRDTAAFIAKGRQKQSQESLKETAARAQDLQKRRSLYTEQRQAQSAAVRGEQEAAGSQAQQMAQQAQAAQAARASASQDNLANSIATRQANSEATRAARPVPVDNTQELAARAKAAQDRQAAYTAQRQAQSSEVRGTKAAAAADEVKAAGSKRIAEGDFTGLDLKNPRAAALLEHVDAPDVATVQQTLSQIAASSPTKGRVIHQLLTPGGRKLTKQEFYGLQHDLQQVHGTREVAQPTQGALSDASGALTSHIGNPVSYKETVRQAGSALDHAVEKAPTEEMAGFAHRVAALKSPEAKEALVASRLASATPTEAKYINELVSPLTKYGKKK